MQSILRNLHWLTLSARSRADLLNCLSACADSLKFAKYKSLFRHLPLSGIVAPTPLRRRRPMRQRPPNASLETVGQVDLMTKTHIPGGKRFRKGAAKGPESRAYRRFRSAWRSRLCRAVAERPSNRRRLGGRGVDRGSVCSRGRKGLGLWIRGTLFSRGRKPALYGLPAAKMKRRSRSSSTRAVRIEVA